MLQRLKVDDIVHPDDRVKAREYECPICLGIPPTSSVVLTACCQNITCTECIAPLEACPNCRTGFEGDSTKTVPLPAIVHRILHNIKVVCPFSHTSRDATGPENSSSSNDIQATGGAGGGICTENPRDGGGSSEHADSCCDWTGNYGDLLTKHIAECVYAEIDCPHGCGERFLRGQLSTHEEGCEKGYEECAICGVMVKIGGMAGHQAEAAEAHVKILSGEILDLRALVAERDAVLAKVDGVKADVDLIGKLIAVNGLGPRVSWKVKTDEVFEKCKEKGDSFVSPEFDVGACKFSIWFEPLGGINSPDGMAGLYIKQTIKWMCFPGEVEIVVSAVGNEFAAISRPLFWKDIFDAAPSAAHGMHSLMEIIELRKAPEIVINLRHADGDNGRVIEVGAPTETHSTSTDRTLEVVRAESQSFMEEIWEGLGCVANHVDTAKAELKQELQPRDMTDVLGAVQALSTMQAEMKEREQLHAHKADAEFQAILDLADTASKSLMQVVDDRHNRVRGEMHDLRKDVRGQMFQLGQELEKAVQTLSADHLRAVQAEFKGREQLQTRRMLRLQDLSADVKAMQAEAKEREHLQTQKAAEARTLSLVSLGVTAVTAAAVICLAIVVGRK